jgi:hypothetical protein
VIDFSKSFDWFSQPADERAPGHGSEAKDQLAQLWDEVRSQTGAEQFDRVLGSTRAGKLASRSDGAWVQTNGEKDHSFVNMTLEIDAAELSLNVIGWFDDQLGAMERWLRQPAAWRFLRTLPDWVFVIFIRQAHIAADGRPVFQGAPGSEKERIAFSETSPANISTRLAGLRPRLDSDREKLSLHIRRSWTAVDCAEIDDLPGAVAPEVEQWFQPIQEIRLA